MSPSFFYHFLLLVAVQNWSIFLNNIFRLNFVHISNTSPRIPKTLVLCAPPKWVVYQKSTYQAKNCGKPTHFNDIHNLAITKVQRTWQTDDRCITVSNICAHLTHVCQEHFWSWMFSRSRYNCSWSDQGSEHFQYVSLYCYDESFVSHRCCTCSIASHPQWWTSPCAGQTPF